MKKRTKKTEMIMMAVPIDMLTEAGICSEDTIQMYVSGSRIIIEGIDSPEEFICSGDCDDCLFSELDCDGECDICPCHIKCDESEAN